jgi:thioredoxin 1
MEDNMTFKFTDVNFQTEAMESAIPVLVDFYADWCGPCKMMAPIIEDLADEYKNVIKIGKLNIDKEPITAGKFHVMSIPTMLIIKNGVTVDTIIGAVSKKTLQNKLEANK